MLDEVTVRFPEAWQLKQADLLNYMHTNPKFDDLIGCDVYGIALAYIQNLEAKNRQLEARVRLLSTFNRLLK